MEKPDFFEDQHGLFTISFQKIKGSIDNTTMLVIEDDEKHTAGIELSTETLKNIVNQINKILEK